MTVKRQRRGGDALSLIVGQASSFLPFGDRLEMGTPSSYLYNTHTHTHTHTDTVMTVGQHSTKARGREPGIMELGITGKTVLWNQIYRATRQLDE